MPPLSPRAGNLEGYSHLPHMEAVAGGVCVLLEDGRTLLQLTFINIFVV